MFGVKPSLGHGTRTDEFGFSVLDRHFGTLVGCVKSILKQTNSNKNSKYNTKRLKSEIFQEFELDQKTI